MTAGLDYDASGEAAGAARRRTTELTLAHFDPLPINVDVATLSSRRDVGVFKSSERYFEVEHEGLPSYLVILPTRMPDPVFKMRGDHGRGLAAVLDAFTVQPAHQDGRWRTTNGEGFETIKFMFSEAALSEVAADAFGPKVGDVSLPDVFNARDPMISHLLACVGEELVKENGLPDLYVDSVVQTLMLRLLRRHSTLARPELRRAAVIPKRAFERVIEFIDANLGENLTLASISDVAGVSPYHFLRAFKAETGETPHRYVMLRRVHRVRNLLDGTDLPLADIAYACGFSSQSHMTTAFRRANGVTPGQYRREKRS